MDYSVRGCVKLQVLNLTILVKVGNSERIDLVPHVKDALQNAGQHLGKLVGLLHLEVGRRVALLWALVEEAKDANFWQFDHHLREVSDFVKDVGFGLVVLDDSLLIYRHVDLAVETWVLLKHWCHDHGPFLVDQATAQDAAREKGWDSEVELLSCGVVVGL